MKIKFIVELLSLLLIIVISIRSAVQCFKQDMQSLGYGFIFFIVVSIYLLITIKK